MTTTPTTLGAIGPDAIQRYDRAVPRNAARDRGEVERDVQAGAVFTEATMREVAADVAFRTVSRANHWVPKENAEERAAWIRGA